MAATKAVQALLRAKIPHSLHTYEYDPDAQEIGQHAADALGVDAAIMLKTLMVEGAGKVVLALVPSDRQLNLKALANAAGLKKCALVAKPDAERISGYVIGGISPLGQKKRLPVFIDDSVEELSEIYCNGGRRGLQLKLNPKDLCKATNGRFASIC